MLTIAMLIFLTITLAIQVDKSQHNNRKLLQDLLKNIELA